LFPSISCHSLCHPAAEGAGGEMGAIQLTTVDFCASTAFLLVRKSILNIDQEDLPTIVIGSFAVIIVIYASPMIHSHTSINMSAMFLMIVLCRREYRKNVFCLLQKRIATYKQRRVNAFVIVCSLLFSSMKSHHTNWKLETEGRGREKEES
jgi:hypothetical protein